MQLAQNLIAVPPSFLRHFSDISLFFLQLLTVTSQSFHFHPSNILFPSLQAHTTIPSNFHSHLSEFSPQFLRVLTAISPDSPYYYSKLTPQFLQFFIATSPSSHRNSSEFSPLSLQTLLIITPSSHYNSVKFSLPSSKFHCFFSGISPPIDLPFFAAYHNRHYTISSESHPRSGSHALPSSQVLRAITPCHPSRLAATPQERRTPPLPKQPISSCDSAPFALRFSPFRTMKWALLACERGYIAQGGFSLHCLAGRQAK